MVNEFGPEGCERGYGIFRECAVGIILDDWHVMPARDGQQRFAALQ